MATDISEHTVSYRPEYIVAVTQNSPGRLGSEVTNVTLDMAPIGLSAGEMVSGAQSPGSEAGYNWVIDTDGTIYELTGWDRAAPGHLDEYFIGLVSGDQTGRQRLAIDWLLEQLKRKKGVPRL